MNPRMTAASARAIILPDLGLATHVQDNWPDLEVVLDLPS
jgi:hypothetical protein